MQVSLGNENVLVDGPGFGPFTQTFFQYQVQKSPGLRLKFGYF